MRGGGGGWSHRLLGIHGMGQVEEVHETLDTSLHQAFLRRETPAREPTPYACPVVSLEERKVVAAAEREGGELGSGGGCNIGGGGGARSRASGEALTVQTKYLSAMDSLSPDTPWAVCWPPSLAIPWSPLPTATREPEQTFAQPKFAIFRVHFESLNHLDFKRVSKGKGKWR